MTAVIQWAVRNSPSMNTLMIAVIVVGAISLSRLQRERFPEHRPDEITIRVDYPGASPEEAEQAICLRIEEAIRSIPGIRQLTAVGREGQGTVTALLHTDVDDSQRVLDEVRSAIDQISRFPESAEEPRVRLNVRYRNVISVAIVGPQLQQRERTAVDDNSKDRLGYATQSERELRYLAEQMREELLRLPAVSHLALWHERPFQIDVELSKDVLRQHGISHDQVMQAIRESNVEVPAGEIRTDREEYLLRIDNRRLTAAGIAAIPVLTRPDGIVLTVGDLATVRDGFVDVQVQQWVNGRPAATLELRRSPDDDMISIHEQVLQYADQKQLPDGYELIVWNDYSRQARERLALLADNALVGLALVFVMLTLFLNLRLAFWVAAGIPVAVFGTCAAMHWADATLNMYSMFAFVMALGIVVDDAIVISENIYRHRQSGMPPVQAAVTGTTEVAPSVICSVLTTVIAFLPLAYVSGDLGKQVAVIPLPLVAMLLLSLLEGLFILPGHLSNLPSRDESPRGFNPVASSQQFVRRGLDFVVQRIQVPALNWCLKNPAIAGSTSVASLLITAGLYFGGFTPFVMQQKLDWEFLYAYIDYPKGTPTSVIEQGTEQLETALYAVDPGNQTDGKPLFRNVYRGLGHTTRLDDRRGDVYVEFDKDRVFTAGYPTSNELIAEWREKAGEFPQAERVVFWGLNNAPGGRPIELSLLSSDIEQLDSLAAAVKQQLATYAGVHDITDSRGPGKWETRLRIKPDAESMGVTPGDMARSVRSAFFGAEAMRLQRGRHEVKVMVHYPRAEQRTLSSLDDLRVRTTDGDEVPLPELADVRVERGYSQILRTDQQRAVIIRADVDENQANARDIVLDLQQDFLPDLLSRHPDVQARWEGQQKETRESVGSLFIGFVIAVFGMFALLTLKFRSYVQPLLILAVIPFGFTGAIWGHWLLDQPITLFSLFGAVTLSGILVNDSIVLIDFINRRMNQGVALTEALLDASCTRFRAVLLTSLTTIAALLPILFEQNTQAQVLIPMAISIAFGLAVSTLWILILVPTMFQSCEQLRATVHSGQQSSTEVPS